MRALDRLQTIVDTRIDGRAVAITRVIIGIAALLQMIDTAAILSAVLDDTKMQLPYIAQLPVVSANWLPLYLLLWCVVAVLFTIGWRTWLSGAALSLILSYSLVVDQQSYSNHVYLLTLIVVLLTLAHGGGRFSVDARLGRAQETIPAWPIVLLKWQMSIVYFFAAVSKINITYISGGILAINMREGWAFPLPDAWLRWELMMPLAIVSILTEMFLALAFWSPRYRYSAIFIGIAFHVVIALTFPMRTGFPLAIFGIMMFATYLQFINIDVVKAKFLRPYHHPIESRTTVK